MAGRQGFELSPGEPEASWGEPLKPDEQTGPNELRDWLGGRDSNPDNGVQSAVSYR